MANNLYQQALMDAPSVDTECCAVCGRHPVERHHVVFRSQGGTDGATITLCGRGNTSGCHGLAHAYMLHFRYEDGWQYIRFDAPTKYDKALKADGWRWLSNHKPVDAPPPKRQTLQPIGI